MAALQPAIVRTYEDETGYDVWIPLETDATGHWAKVELRPTWWHNVDETNAANICRYYLPVQAITIGRAHEGKVYTVANGGITEANGGGAGAWGAGTKSQGRTSGKYYRVSTHTTGTNTATASIPAGHDRIAVCVARSSAPKAAIGVSFAGESIAGGLTYTTDATNGILTEQVYTVTAQGAAADFVVTPAPEAGVHNFKLIGIRSWKSGTYADPRDNTATLWDGNDLTSTFNNAGGGVGAGGWGHARNLFTDCTRMCTGNTLEAQIEHDTSGAADFTAYGAHYGSGDDIFTVTGAGGTTFPQLYLDGAAAVEMTGGSGGTVPLGTVMQADRITCRTVGTDETAKNWFEYIYDFTSSGIGVISHVTWGAASTVSIAYAGGLSGSARSGMLAAMTGYFKVPNDSTQHAIPSASLSAYANICDIYWDGAPWIIRMSGSGPGVRMYETTSNSKVYAAVDPGAYVTPSAGPPNVTWAFSTHYQFMRRPFSYWGGAKG